MRRRIIRQGNDSYTLTLPVRWVRDAGLGPGDEVDLEDDEGRLVVIGRPQGKRSPSAITVDVSKYHERTVRNVLGQTYRKGYDRMTLRTKDAAQLAAIRLIAKETLLGFEVTSTTTGSCTLESIAEPSDERFETILRKVFLLIKTQSHDLLDAFVEGKPIPIGAHEATKASLDLYTNFLRRLVVKRRIGAKNAYALFAFLSQLSYVGHGFYYLAALAAKAKAKPKKESLKLYGKLLEMYALLYESFYGKETHAVLEDTAGAVRDIAFTPDLDKAHRVGALRDQSLPLLQEALRNARGEEAVYISQMQEIMRLLQLAATNLFGLASSSSVHAHQE